jgi:hypothetical protein
VFSVSCALCHILLTLPFFGHCMHVVGVIPSHLHPHLHQCLLIV